MKVSVSKERSDLIRLIGLFRPSSDCKGSVVCRVLLWDGRIVDASYAGDKAVDLETREQSFPPEMLVDLAAFVDRMLGTEQAFVATTGCGDQVCTLKWHIGRVVNH